MHFHFLLESMVQRADQSLKRWLSVCRKEDQFHCDALSGSPGQSLCRSVGIRSQTLWGGWDGWDVWKLNWPWCDHDISIVNLSWVVFTYLYANCLRATLHVGSVPIFPQVPRSWPVKPQAEALQKPGGPEIMPRHMTQRGRMCSINFQIWQFYGQTFVPHLLGIDWNLLFLVSDPGTCKHFGCCKL